MGEETPVRDLFQGRKKSAVLAHYIVNEIVAQEMSAGDRLPAEAEMCAEYGVGRSTIREALRVLESQGVITIKTGPGGGPVVTPFDTAFLAANIALHLQLSGGTFRDIMDARMVIEPAIAGAAAERSDPELAERLMAVVDRCGEGAGHDGLIAGAADFHDLVAEGSGNPFFIYLMQAFHRITEPFALRLSYEGERRDRLVAHHAAIAEAIASGDRDVATDMMRQDLLEFFDYVEQEAPQLLGERIDWGRVKT